VLGGFCESRPHFVVLSRDKCNGATRELAFRKKNFSKNNALISAAFELSHLPICVIRGSGVRIPQPAYPVTASLRKSRSHFGFDYIVIPNIGTIFTWRWAWTTTSRSRSIALTSSHA